MAASLDDDDAGVLGFVGGFKGELRPQIDHGDDLPAQVDYTLHVAGRSGDGGNIHVPDDLADPLDRQPILLVPKIESEVLAPLMGGGNGALR